jgi:hydrogenase nickel incorporation protein HypA/HybF
MHELSLVEAVVNTLKGLQSKNKWKRVVHVTLKVGQMRQVEPEVFDFAFHSSVVGTPLEGVELSIIETPVSFSCQACHQTSNSEEYHFICPVCGSPDVDLVSGMELTIESIEVEGMSPRIR